jgi:DNA-binding NtrC family response regulator
MTPPYPNRPVLIVDDELPWLRSLTLRLERSLGIDNVVTADNGDDALARAKELAPSLVLLDITMPGLNGEEVLERLHEERPDLPVIVHTAHNDVDVAVRCTRLGAFDYYLKTGEQERLIGGVRRALAMVALRSENRRLQERVSVRSVRQPEVFQDIVSCSPAILDLCLYLEAIAASREPLLITGESGVGKELVARALWQLATPHGPWQAVNAAGLDDNVFADTLFGHVRGAYTGADQARSGLVEQANGGILFLDEIGDLALGSQVKLLRLLQGGDYLPLGSDKPKRANLRIVAATNLDLAARVESGQFRRDLYYRLMAHHAHLPPLRERREDIPLLARHFASAAAANQGTPSPELPDDVLAALMAAPWSGNIRELRSRLFDAISRSRGEPLSLQHFPGLAPAASLTAPSKADSVLMHCPGRLPTFVEAGEFLVAEAMRRAGGNQTLAAGMLGITRQGLAKRLKK